MNDATTITPRKPARGPFSAAPSPKKRMLGPSSRMDFTAVARRIRKHTELRAQRSQLLEVILEKLRTLEEEAERMHKFFAQRVEFMKELKKHRQICLSSSDEEEDDE
ncbi:hypothetical protein KEM52_003056 [Ascosphaera acerosa]|nr:hypothetical protein KEM52_003056 [Ascosphaera acerosa]